ncbi:MAG: hypothetical protein ABIN67_09510 [Ferruginibacter sp.]
MPTNYPILLILILFSCKTLKAQQWNGNSIFDERRFLFEVKQIDEFFERFNNDKRSFIKRNIGKYYPGIKIDRPSLLRTLFDKESKQIVPASKKEFIKDVTDPNDPLFLKFYKPGWWAEASCIFTYNNKPVSAKVMLVIETDSSRASKWVIKRVQCNEVKQYTGNILFPNRQNPAKFLSPMSHATNFIALARAFDDKANIGSYITDDCRSDNSSVSFMQALITGQLTFRYINSIKYYFSQIPGWRFTVASCVRTDSVNSGWLVTDMVNVQNK